MLSCYEEVNELRAVIQTAHYLNMLAISHQLGPGNLVVQQLWHEVCGKWNQIQDLQHASQLFSPSKNNEMDIDAQSLALMISGLKEELSAYLAKADSQRQFASSAAAERCFSPHLV